MTIKLRFMTWGILLPLLTTNAVAQPAGPLPREELQVLASAYDQMQRFLAQKPDDRALLVAAIKGLVRGADPDSGEYFTAEEFEAFRQPSRIDQESLGAEIKVKGNQYILVPLGGSPAARAGVIFGDQLYAVDGVRVKGLDPTIVEKKLAGPPGTKVALTIFRESTLSVLTITVERKVFSMQSASLSRPAPGVVLLRVGYFNESALQEAADVLKTAWRSEPFKALILDLRGCPGGLLDTSVGIAAMFLPNDALVVQTAGESTESNASYFATPAFYQRKGGIDPLADLPREIKIMPMAVLVDNATVSGGEVVAAALQDHKRATVIGRPTFGRASIQTVRPLQIGAIKFTSSYFFPPSGRKIDGNGITPNQIVDDPWAADTMRTALKALKLGM